MQKQIIKLLAIVSVVGALCGVRAGEIAASFPDRCTVIGRLDVAAFRAIPVVRQAFDSHGGHMTAFVDQVREWVGVDLDTVRRVWLGVEKDGVAVVALEGAFDAGLIQGGILNIDTAQFVPKEGVPMCVLLPDEKKPGQVNMAAVLDDRTLVLGQPAITEDFIDAFTGVAKGASSARLRQVRGLVDSDPLLHAFIFGVAPKDLEKNPWLNLLSHGELKADLAGDMVIQLAIGSKTPELLKPLQGIVEGALAVYKQMDGRHRKVKPGQKLLLDNMVCSVSEQQIVLESTIPEQALNGLISAKLNGGGAIR